VIKQIDIYRKHCLWSKGDISRRGSCLVAWETACKPKDQGGLGIIDIKSQNNALLMKFLDKFYNKAEIPWVHLTWSKLYANTQTSPQARSPVGSFWWKEIINLFENYQSLSVCRPGKGDSILFWSGKWTNQELPLKDLFPQLYSFARKQKCSVRFFIDQEVNRVFTLPLSQQASNQLDEVENLIDTFVGDSDQKDSWSYIWGSSKFSSRKAYIRMIGQSEASPLFKWMWASSNLGSTNSFFGC